MSAFDELQKKQERGEKLTSLEFAVWWCSDTVAAKAAADELAALHERVEKLNAVLQSIEFSCEIKIKDKFVFHCCPKCGGILEEFVKQKHKDGCELAAALKSENQ